MLISDKRVIGNSLLSVRKRKGLTQVEVAEAAGLSDRTYADIERGNVNMRLETLLQICRALDITPNEILTIDDDTSMMDMQELTAKLSVCPLPKRKTAMRLLSVYIKSLE